MKSQAGQIGRPEAPLVRGNFFNATTPVEKQKTDKAQFFAPPAQQVPLTCKATTK